MVWWMVWLASLCDAQGMLGKGNHDYGKKGSPAADEVELPRPSRDDEDKRLYIEAFKAGAASAAAASGGSASSGGANLPWVTGTGPTWDCGSRRGADHVSWFLAAPVWAEVHALTQWYEDEPGVQDETTTKSATYAAQRGEMLLALGRAAASARRAAGVNLHNATGAARNALPPPPEVPPPAGFPPLPPMPVALGTLVNGAVAAAVPRAFVDNSWEAVRAQGADSKAGKDQDENKVWTVADNKAFLSFNEGSEYQRQFRATQAAARATVAAQAVAAARGSATASPRPPAAGVPYGDLQGTQGRGGAWGGASGPSSGAASAEMELEASGGREEQGSGWSSAPSQAAADSWQGRSWDYSGPSAGSWAAGAVGEKAWQGEASDSGQAEG